MEWDLGARGIGTLLGMSLIFGVFSGLVFWGRAAVWIGLVATAAFFVAGLFISEVWFGWATAEELQPNIDGLSFDEVLLSYLFLGIPIVFIARYLARGRIRRSATH